MDKNEPKKVVKKKTKSPKVVVPKTTKNLFGDNTAINTENSENKSHDTIELLLKLSEQIFSREDIDIKTVLNKRQVVAFAQASLYADIFNVPVVKNMVEKLSIYSISENGLSRKEFTELAKSIMSYTNDQDRQTLSKHLLGSE